MSSCSENNISDILHNSFVVDHDHFGKLTAHELKPGGKDILVTEENKTDYIRLYVLWRLQRGTLSQFSALMKGFHELVPQDLLKGFDEKELEVCVGACIYLADKAKQVCVFCLLFTSSLLVDWEELMLMIGDSTQD